MASESLIERIKRSEGLRLKPYLCPANKWTIGYGRNIEDNGITEEEALYLLMNDIKQAENELSEYGWFIGQSLVRREVLIDMCYNMGLPTLLGFTKMIAALNRYDYVCAANELMDSVYARKAKSRAEELKALMLRG